MTLESACDYVFGFWNRMPIIDSRVKVRPKEEEQEKGSGRTFHKRIYQAKVPWKETRKDLRLFGSNSFMG